MWLLIAVLAVAYLVVALVAYQLLHALTSPSDDYFNWSAFWAALFWPFSLARYYLGG